MDLTVHPELQEKVLASFIGEIDALKPGNISRYAAGHGMEYEDFVKSAEVSTPILCDSSRPVGRRILESVTATQEAVGCNTNLGMLLLFAPIIQAYQRQSQGGGLQVGLNKVLAALQHQDTNDVLQAISLAKPAGLGQVEQYDVHLAVEEDLLTVMGAAAGYDLIAREYVTDFKIVSTTGLNCLRKYFECWNSVEWATVACYLYIMSSFPDSHIRRKFGQGTAEKIRNRTVLIYEQFKNNKNPDSAVPMLLDFDRELKDSKINPGTCADLTAASLLLYKLRV